MSYEKPEMPSDVELLIGVIIWTETTLGHVLNAADRHGDEVVVSALGSVIHSLHPATNPKLAHLEKEFRHVAVDAGVRRMAREAKLQGKPFKQVLLEWLTEDPEQEGTGEDGKVGN